MDFKVCVKCMTFNQASYIEDAMNGFCMQKTNFPFLCVVMDDCSTDGEQEVIKKYVSDNFVEEWSDDSDDCIRLMARHKNNENCYFLVVYLKYNHYSIKKAKKPYFKEWHDSAQYLALCEGDDYWIDPKKLQKQIDILDSNPDCTLCYHACMNKYEEDFIGAKSDFGAVVNDTYSFKDVVWFYYFQTATVLYRREIVDTDYYHKLINAGFSFGDNLLYYTSTHFGKLIGVNEKMSVYRRTKNGISNYIHKWEMKKSDTIAFISILDIFTRDERKEILKKKVYPLLLSSGMFKATPFVDYFKMLLKVVILAPFRTFVAVLRFLFIKSQISISSRCSQ